MHVGYAGCTVLSYVFHIVQT